MRTARLIEEGRSFYHVVSRVVDRRMVFEAKDKEVFRNIMRNLEAFMGVRVVTYCLMSNHFHLLLEVPDRDELPELTEEELLAVLPRLHDGSAVLTVKQELERARKSGDERWHREILDRYEYRRGSLSFFLKELKQRVTLYMNKRLGRTGTLWEGRFKSVLVEGNQNALLTIAAYIDLNPVRAGIVNRPEEYRWCGYAESLSGTRNAKLAREGLGVALAESLADGDFKASWPRTRSRYRQFLFEEGEEREENAELGQRSRRGFSQEKIEAVTEKRGEMTVPEVLRDRVRYFCDGVVLGSAEFVDDVFARGKEKGLYGEKRTTGARKMRGAEWGSLRVLRDLQVNVIGSG
ncbi:MAG: chemotaxis protein CheW [Verrucomicrobiales bacterium]|nr:chemotaxis protein CheW [Verrucomicrobiales bacterium]